MIYGAEASFFFSFSSSHLTVLRSDRNLYMRERENGNKNGNGNRNKIETNSSK